MLLEWGKFPKEMFAMQSLSSRLMAYSKGLPGGKALRTRFSTVTTLGELEDIAAEHIKDQADRLAARETALSA